MLSFAVLKQNIYVRSTCEIHDDVHCTYMCIGTYPCTVQVVHTYIHFI